MGFLFGECSLEVAKAGSGHFNSGLGIFQVLIRSCLISDFVNYNLRLCGCKISIKVKRISNCFEFGLLLGSDHFGY